MKLKYLMLNSAPPPKKKKKIVNCLIWSIIFKCVEMSSELSYSCVKYLTLNCHLYLEMG